MSSSSEDEEGEACGIKVRVHISTWKPHKNAKKRRGRPPKPKLVYRALRPGEVVEKDDSPPPEEEEMPVPKKRTGRKRARSKDDEEEESSDDERFRPTRANAHFFCFQRVPYVKRKKPNGYVEWLYGC
jgi:hypothetical protein